MDNETEAAVNVWMMTDQSLAARMKSDRDSLTKQREKGDTLEMKTRGVKSEWGAHWNSRQVTGVAGDNMNW